MNDKTKKLVKKLAKFLGFIVILAVADYLDTLEQSFYVGLPIRPFRQFVFIIILPIYIFAVYTKFNKKIIPFIILLSVGLWNVIYGILLPNPVEGVYYWFDPIIVVNPLFHWILSISFISVGLIGIELLNK